MRSAARIAVVSGLLGLVAMGCASIAGIEDLSLTGSPDASGGTVDSRWVANATASCACT